MANKNMTRLGEFVSVLFKVAFVSGFAFVAVSLLLMLSMLPNLRALAYNLFFMVIAFGWVTAVLWVMGKVGFKK